ncbi:MAG: class I SAM-dependent methyltransferase [Clostridia bacterium]|nr:class I SAM-dependent methyltransferase [Clostridia bacterium]MBQ8552562.1 class I SAM-dependent methyltransferase [Clostridia bacterium]
MASHGSDAYTSLAPVYDRLNSEIDYEGWADHIEAQFRSYAKKQPESVLDLACGTGAMTVILARRGYDMTGIDLSEDMLAVARDRCDRERFSHSVLLIRQDMSEFELYGTVDAIVCCLDSLNYLTKIDDLRRTLLHVHNYLEPDGLFVFDMNAPAKFCRVYGQNSYILEDDGVLCAWQNDYNAKTKLCDFYLSIFTENENGTWQRYDEIQRERCYSLRTVKKLLSECGFELCSLSAGFDGSEVNEDTERWYFTARAKK